MYIFVFFFQAEDGIRDTSVTGVQTCALPIFLRGTDPVVVNHPNIETKLRPRPLGVERNLAHYPRPAMASAPPRTLRTHHSDAVATGTTLARTSVSRPRDPRRDGAQELPLGAGHEPA